MCNQGSLTKLTREQSVVVANCTITTYLRWYSVCTLQEEVNEYTITANEDSVDATCARSHDNTD